MNAQLAHGVVEAFLADCDVHVGGPRAWDPQIHDPHFYRRVLHSGSLGLGESYMDGWWDVEALDELLQRLLAAHMDARVHGRGDWRAWLRHAVWNLQRVGRARDVVERHYDLGNDLYAAMLGPSMAYSCGYWREAGDLDAAQRAKFDLVCRKLQLQRGMRVLDIGCGFGTALEFAARTYGASGTGITLSQEQARYARQRCAGLPIEIRVLDYRDPALFDARYDRVLSIGMFEHVGVKNYRRFFRVARRCLAPDGLFLLHSIGAESTSNRTDPWIEKYIFPNSMLPSVPQLGRALEGLFVIEDWHNFGADYARTLRAWLDNVEAAWETLPSRYDERFRRMWRFYLCAAAAVFRTRRNQLWQLVLSPHGVPGGYASVR